MQINLLKDGNGKYVKDVDLMSTWSVAHMTRFLMFANWIVSHKCKHVLDVGFGDNVLVDFLEKLSFKGKYLGIDLNENFVVDAIEKTHKSFTTVYDVAEIYELEGQFDCIVLGEVIEHITPDEAPNFLAHAKSLLSKRGTIILSTPNRINEELVWPKDHEREFSMEELYDLAEGAGLCVISKYGLWNNTKRTEQIMSDYDKSCAREMSAYLPKSILNVMYALGNPNESKQIIMFLQKGE